MPSSPKDSDGMTSKGRSPVHDLLIQGCGAKPKLGPWEEPVELCPLEAELRDDSFLRDARVVIAHPSRRSLFVDTYCWNYVQDDSRNQLGERVR